MNLRLTALNRVISCRWYWSIYVSDTVRLLMVLATHWLVDFPVSDHGDYL